MNTTRGAYAHDRLWACIEHTERGEGVLTLARTGVLTLLVRWAAENCAPPNLEVGLSCPPRSSQRFPTLQSRALVSDLGQSCLQVAEGPVFPLLDRLVTASSLVEAAVNASGVDSVQAVHERYHREGRGVKDLYSPESWQRLRLEVVEPLVLALEARAAAAEGDAARQAQLAVDVAEALATRP